MSNSYITGHRAPNVSAYLANLNTVHDVNTSPIDFDPDTDGLDFLTNAEFFDFDTFTPDLAQPQPMLPTLDQKPARIPTSGPQYQFGEFQTYPNTSTAPALLPTSPNDGIVYNSQSPTFYAHDASTGEKRKSVTAGLPLTADLEEASRGAAEEDKRRRNTAASARFRVKKKQREQALEKQTREMSDKVSALESKIQQLEMENKWLKELITEKGDATGEKKLVEGAEKKAAESSLESRDDGVGTGVVEA